ncbi:hypothetical protein FBZ98_107243 [Rhizobium sp. ERR 922]|uniref:hypothetical protein n=1 Tax=Rhizobium TaxID=379 RepID=UPI000DDFEF5B|nr:MULTISPECIES: hypothetical protein [Rhizobium]TWB08838.1 hypothetical protein FBZ99_11737 [Rhizobium sp. ERR1071]TWB49210.1 hypothetical protein FBZ98_107243 [Rhizobium sp. ERR 922]TWB91741.1 hypothetical protein FBZ97_107244 [Rhizobium sp. ERR 942]GES41594.1 hypothetical protein RsS62_08460 [Rhizobium dioscoreae]
MVVVFAAEQCAQGAAFEIVGHDDALSRSLRDANMVVHAALKEVFSGRIDDTRPAFKVLTDLNDLSAFSTS